MFRTILWFINFVLYLIYSCTYLIKLKFLKSAGKTKEYDEYLHKVTSKWARKMVSNTGSKVVVVGVEKVPSSKNVLFVSNHQGNFDIPILIGFIDKPKAFIAKIELLKVPIIKTWMKKMGCIFLDRKHPKAAIQVMNKAIEELNTSTSLVIFPEGTRSRGNNMGEFKKGSFKPAIKTNGIIVPVTINGSYTIMEANNNKMKPSTVKVIISDPIDISKLNEEDLKNLHTYVRDIISSKLQ